MDNFQSKMDDQGQNVPEHISHLLRTGSFTPVQRKYIRQIPWNKTDCPQIEIECAREILDKSHYGMKNIKQQILRYLACQRHLGTAYGDVLLLVGPPGVGKTSIAKAIANSMNRPFFKIPLAGISDAGPLRGYDTNYKDPKPGLIVEGLIRTQTMCPLILLDEIDKLGGSTSNGYPEHVLLHILDSDRTDFVDDMIEVPVNISNVVFVATANSLATVSPILLDRFEVIKLNGYTKEEKIKIAMDYIIPNLRTEFQLDKFELDFSSELIEYLVQQYSHDPGIRSLKRAIKMLLESIIMICYTGGEVPAKLTVAEYMRIMQIEPRKPKGSPRRRPRKTNLPYNY